MTVAKTAAALAAGLARRPCPSPRSPRTARTSRPPPTRPSPTLVLDELATVDWIEKSDVAALREGVIEKMELQIGMPVSRTAADRLPAQGDRRADRRQGQDPGRATSRPIEKAQGPEGGRRFGRAPATSGSTSASRAWSRPRTWPRPRASSRSPMAMINEAEEQRGRRQGRARPGQADPQGAHDRRPVRRRSSSSG